METVDFAVIALYLFGIIAAGLFFSRRMKDSRDMFAAGGQSPWWVSGLSGFMTMFSAGTFVVWGGIAYRYGAVAIVINLGYGVAAMLVGMFVAGRWRKLGVDSAAEFLQLRFGDSIVQFYTWFKGTVGLFVMGGSIYAFSKIACALVPLPEGHLLVDASTGHLSIPLTSIALSLLVIVITLAGGLWAVLVTDVLQFLVLTVSVVIVVPLILSEAGGFSMVVEKAPDGFFEPVAGDYSWWFVTTWMLVNFCMIGAEWTFVQRFLCVPTPRDAKRSAYLFAAMYFVSPIIWMLPPLVFRVIEPNLADAEQAYIYACRSVLPAGLMGLMVAAMASATASMATTRLNVFAGAFTTEFYQRRIKPDASERQLVLVGRVITALLGTLVIAGALLIPMYGYTSFILDMNKLLYGPMLMPTIWGLFSRKLGLRAVWATVIIGFAAAYVIKFGLSPDGVLMNVTLLAPITDWISDHRKLVENTIGILVPAAVLLAFELFARQEHPRWSRVQQYKHAVPQQHAPVTPSTLPGFMVAIGLFLLATIMLVVALMNRSEVGLLVSVAVVLLLVGGIVIAFNRQQKQVPDSDANGTETSEL